LRERDKDKVLLARYLFEKIKGERDWACKGLSSEALDAIRQHGWPGNVREMINRIRRAMVVQDGWIKAEDLELFPTEAITKTPRLKEAHSGLKRLTVESALREHQYNVTHSARALGISRTYLYLLMKQLNIAMVRQKIPPGKS
jgi:DNA-binding NtrC family response regulator